MKLSTKGRYGLKAMFELALHYGEGPIPLKNVAESQGISEHYLEQLIAVLRKNGLVQSVRELKDGTGYKLTTAQYFTPSGEYINGKGIKPTIEEKDEEKQLNVATEWIKEQIKK